MIHEGICHDYRRGLWADYFGASLADDRGRAARRDGAVIYSPHRGLGQSVFLGVAPG